MFDIGAIELLVVAVVAIIVIGPKDMPQAMRMAGRWVGKVRRISAQFRSGFDAMVREAELEDMEKTWKEQNARIMNESGGEQADAEMEPLAARAERKGSTASQASGRDISPSDPIAANDTPVDDTR